MTLNLLGGSQGITRPSEMGGTAAEVWPVSDLSKRSAALERGTTEAGTGKAGGQADPGASSRNQACSHLDQPPQPTINFSTPELGKNQHMFKPWSGDLPRKSWRQNCCCQWPKSSPPAPAPSLFALGGGDSLATICFHRSRKGLDRVLGDLEKGP